MQAIFDFDKNKFFKCVLLQKSQKNETAAINIFNAKSDLIFKRMGVKLQNIKLL